MKRRKFLQLSAPAALTPLFLNGLPLQTFASPNLLNCEGVSDRVIVLVQMDGGNDGINTLVPIHQYDVYRNIRPSIGLNDTGSNGFIPLDNTLSLEDQIGLHPALTSLKDMYDQGKVNVIQDVSYDNHNGSHFKSTDLWMTGGDGTPQGFNYTSGWMGRYLDYRFPGLAGRPTTAMPDPLGIQLGSIKLSIGFTTQTPFPAGINLTRQELSGFYNVVRELGGPAPNFPSTEHGAELEYIMNVQNSVSNYAERITDVFNAGNNIATYPGTNLANQFKTVARLLSGGSQTKIFKVQLGGFDTHANQIQQGSPHLGKHSELLTQFGEAVQAFLADLEALGLDDRVLVASLSEFGRRAVENGNQGTDHGNQAPMFLFGKNVNPGVTGTNVNLSNLRNDSLQNPQHDYRQVFATLIQDWLGGGNEALTVAKFDQFIDQKLPIIATASVVDPSCYLLSPLPVILKNFEAHLISDDEVALNWSTSTELNTSHFEVERSKDGVSFDYLTETNASGNSIIPQYYTIYDDEPLGGQSYYRLKILDHDGSFEYSEIRTVRIMSKLEISSRLYPNPARFDARLTFTSSENLDGSSLHLFDNVGHEILARPVSIKSGFNKFEMDVSQLAAGQYWVRLLKNDQLIIDPIALVKI